MNNPLLEDWSTPFGLPPFAAISDADFALALETALMEHDAEIAAIAENPAAPSFANTVLALEGSGAALDRVLSTFFSVAGADTNPKRQELQRLFSPKLADHFAGIHANQALYRRIEALWARRDEMALSGEEARLLMLTRRGFVRAGAALEGAEAQRMREIKSRLSVLGTAFTQNLLADEAGWQMVLSEADLEGLPEFVKASARAVGEERGADGFCNSRPGAICASWPGGPGWRAAPMAARRTTARSRPKCWRCAKSAPSFWATTPSRPTSSRPRWRAGPTGCAIC